MVELKFNIPDKLRPEVIRLDTNWSGVKKIKERHALNRVTIRTLETIRILEVRIEKLKTIKTER